MRDMIQNHLLQILCMIAMSPPSDLSADSIRDEKVKVLKSLRRIDRSNVREKTVRGQYTAGFAQGKKVPGYLEEEGANKPATPKPSWRSAWISITGAGRAYRSTCVPVNVCRPNVLKWWFTSKRRS
jgi:glucose-6-phosphate 1-dehydrogenase